MTQAVKLAGVLGDPIGHSRSPILHGTWLKKYGISGAYIPLHVSKENFETVVRTLPKAGFVGFNVTLPHKERALAIADRVTARAEAIGAANMLTVSAEGELIADNSDGLGFLAHLQQSQPDWRVDDGPIMVLGASGAARAVVQTLVAKGAPEVRVANRTKVRAEDLSDEFGAIVVPWEDRNEGLDQAVLCINTTSLGMDGQPRLEIDLSGLSDKAIVYDLVYAPLETDLLASARARGLRAVDGLGMLLHQAVPGFEAWFGHRPDVDEQLRRAVIG